MLLKFDTKNKIKVLNKFLEINNKKKNKLLILFLSNSIYGISLSKIRILLISEGIPDTYKLKYIKFFLFKNLIIKINNLTNCYNIQQKTLQSLLKLQNLKIYRGDRHKNGYPSRGQRTYTNAKTCRRMKSIINNLNFFQS